MDRSQAIEIFQAGVHAADPYTAVKRALDQVVPPTFVLSIGKAAIRMAEAALDAYAGVRCLIITNPENHCEVPGATVLAGQHPVPDDTSHAAGLAVLSALRVLGPDDHVLALISGGGSALAVAPVDGVSLADKAALNAALLGAGLDIVQTNTVRQAVSQIKGGGLLHAAAPAAMTSLILSDVVGDDPRAVASGPTASPLGTTEDAREIVQAAGIWDGLPASVHAALSRSDVVTNHTCQPNLRLVGSNRLSVEAMAQAVPEATIIDAPLVGDVSDACNVVVKQAKAGPGLHLFGGETTVRLNGNGRGGRNQELAMRVALAMREHDRPFLFLSGGTDGRDGPTDAAGGVVDNGTFARIQTAGVDPYALLANNDSYQALEAAGDLLICPATGTNVADLQVLWVG